jgi:hypothetical protein
MAQFYVALAYKKMNEHFTHFTTSTLHETCRNSTAKHTVYATKQRVPCPVYHKKKHRAIDYGNLSSDDKTKNRELELVRAI